MKRENLNAEVDLVTVVKKARKDGEAFEKITENGLPSSDKPTTVIGIQATSPAGPKIFRNDPNLTSNVKQEPTSENDIQSYAHRAMNELLGLYGYEEVAASDIDSLKPKKDLENEKNGETASSKSPASLQVDPRQITMNYSDDEEVTCSWCGKSCHAALSLQEGENMKSFCSEKCFAACRRAKFKKSRGALTIKCDTERSLFGGNNNLFKRGEVIPENKKIATACSSLEKLLPNDRRKPTLETMKKQERPPAFDLSEKNKIAAIKKKEKPSKVYNRHFNTSIKTHQNKIISDETAKQRKNSPLSNASSEESVSDKLFSGTHKVEFNNESCSNTSKRKFSSDSMNQHSSSKLRNSPDQLHTADLFRQHPFLNMYPSSAFPFLGLPNLVGSSTGNAKLDLDSFRIGLMAALQQSQTADQLANSVTVEKHLSPSPAQNRNLNKQHSPSFIHPQQTEKPAAPKVASSFSNFEDKKYHETKTDWKTKNVGSNFPFPMLLIPFPIPVPIPIPVPMNASSYSNIANEMTSNHRDKVDPAIDPGSSGSHSRGNGTRTFVEKEAKSNANVSCSNKSREAHSNHDCLEHPHGQEDSYSDCNVVIDLSLRTRNSNSESVEADNDKKV